MIYLENNINLFKSVIELKKQIDNNLEELAKSMRITSSELLVLLDVQLYPNTSLVDLCNRTGLKKSAVSKMIGRLEEEGLLVREVCPTSKREVILNITDQFLAKEFCWNESIRILFPKSKNHEKTSKQIENLTKVLKK